MPRDKEHPTDRMYSSERAAGSAIDRLCASYIVFLVVGEKLQTHSVFSMVGARLQTHSALRTVKTQRGTGSLRCCARIPSIASITSIAADEVAWPRLSPTNL